MYFFATVPVQYMSCWTGLNVFGYVRSYGNPFQQTDNHMRLYQKLCAGVNSRIGILKGGHADIFLNRYAYTPSII